MFDSRTYAARRKRLRRDLGSGVALFLGNDESPMNYTANGYPFRQDSSFLYFFGLDTPGLAGIVDVDEGKDILFGDDIDIEDIIWMGFLPTVKERAAEVGVKETRPAKALTAYLQDALAKGRMVHLLPPYRAEHRLKLQDCLGVPPAEAKARASQAFIKAVVAQRSVKSEAEVAEIETALMTTCKMYETAMHMAQPGVYEHSIAGRINGIAMADGGANAFPTILTINGQILHNHGYTNKLAKGRLMVVDSGAESALHYASDITRTIPVGGKFTARQKDIYEIVLAANLGAIRFAKPGLPYKEVHLLASRIIVDGLMDVGLMKGNSDDAIAQGAHALFFPHGLGHMMGLDVHDMENLGENNVGYDQSVERSRQFGLAYLRMARPLRPGHVMTVEPGIYFIPALIDLWRAEKKALDFVAYDKLEAYRGFGGVRIEDDILVTQDGVRVLGRPIPKTAAQVEAASTV
ncbi:MAG: aminopeptidase P family protein [Acidobacteriota bacterium]|nr:aminopeptidase P family protein [Acidobacteriota bacterium]